ncbi:MAG: glycosyltransferase [Roseburia sp.]|nr:glycosyltransferase [Roseburia sp.]
MTKSILFVINTLGRAGAETALLELLKQFRGEAYEVDLFVLMGQGELIEQLPEHVHLLNPHFSPVSVLAKRGRLHMLRRVCTCGLRRGTMLRLFPYLCRNLWRMLRKGRVMTDKLMWRVLSDGAERFEKEYDLAVAYIEGGSAYYISDHVKARKKAAFIHIDYEYAGYTRALDKDCYVGFDRLFPISEETKQGFLKAYPECADRTEVFHNIVDSESILQKASLPGGFTDAFDGIRILTVGRLNKQKSYPTAIRTMKLLKDAGIRARWYVCGEGEERKSLEQLIESLGLKEDFVLLGAVSNPYPYYRQTDYYVHATLFEGKSIAIQEAQILGCRIIVSDCTGNRQQVEHNVDGIICELKEEALRDELISLIQNPQKGNRLAEEAAKKRTSYEKDVALLMELL